MYNSVVEMERGGTNTIPGLALSWEITEGATVFTFKLRKGVKWHSNDIFNPSRDLNADDVVFSFQRQMDKDHPYFKIADGQFSHFFGMGFDRVLKEVDKVDDYTVKFTLFQPDVTFLQWISSISAGIISKEYADQLLKAGTPEFLAQKPIGTGPFQFVSFRPGAQLRFKKFEDNWVNKGGPEDRAALVENLVFAFTPDTGVRFASVKAGECHITRFPNPADIAAAREHPDIEVLSIPSLDYGWVAYNVEKKPFDNRKVREALGLAIDKQAILASVYQGEVGTAAGSVIPPGLLGHDPSIPPVPYDPEKAKKLLAEAGYPNGFKTDLWAMPVVRAYMPNARRAAELIQADWANIGVEAKIVSMDWGEYLQATKDGEHETVILGLNYDYPGPESSAIWGWSCASAKIGWNRARWCNKEWDDLMYAAQREPDPKKRAELIIEASWIFDREKPATMLAYAKFVVFIRNEVVGYKITPVGGQPFYGVGLK